MDTREKELISYCNYYKGEESSPFKSSDQNLIWYYESKWVEFMLEKSHMLDVYIEEYLGAGLKDYSSSDGVEISIKALLFNRYCHLSFASMTELAEPFKTWYKEYYLGGLQKEHKKH